MSGPITVNTLEDLLAHCEHRMQAAKSRSDALAPETPETPARQAERDMWSAIGEANAFYAVIVTIKKMIKPDIAGE